MKTTYVIPTYNEAENIPILLSALFGLAIPDFHVLIVDDNSPDGCGDVAEVLRQRYGDKLHVLHRKGKEGLGQAYIAGLGWAIDDNSDLIGMMDADLSHPPEKIPEMLAAIEDADLVIGSRYIKGGGLDKDWSFWRKTLSRFGNYYSRQILGLSIKDVTGGFKLWRREALLSIPFAASQSKGYVFQVEQAYLASLKGLRIREVPIYFSERIYGSSKMSIKIQLEAAFRVWKLRSIYKSLNIAK